MRLSNSCLRCCNLRIVLVNSGRVVTNDNGSIMLFPLLAKLSASAKESEKSENGQKFQQIKATFGRRLCDPYVNRTCNLGPTNPGNDGLVITQGNSAIQSRKE